MLDVRVKAVSASEWATDIYVMGAYDGPNDIAANEDYRSDKGHQGGSQTESDCPHLWLTGPARRANESRGATE